MLVPHIMRFYVSTFGSSLVVICEQQDEKGGDKLNKGHFWIFCCESARSVLTIT